jgi:peptide/nickel transport system substrate-binding protein/oligopeptide transport system substrate-binding protein
MLRRTLLLFVTLAACGRDAGDAARTAGRRTIIDSRDREDPRSLDPALSTDVPTGRAVGYLFDGLVRFTPDAKVVPALARAWDVSPDGIVYTFHLRQGVRFHDGTPFVARQVARSWQRALDPATRGGRGAPLFPIKGAKEFAAGSATRIDGVAAPNDSTVVVTLAEPLSIFLKLLAMPVAAIVPDSTPKDFGEHPVGTGPWRLVEWKHDDYLLFARNASYFDGPPSADSLRARIIPDASTAVAEFESGNVDVLVVPEAESRQWRASPERSARLRSGPSLRLWYVAINTRRGPLADRRVRQALNHAVDAQAILTQLLGDRGRLAAGVVPPVLDGGDSTRAPYKHDVAHAKDLLAQAGFPNGIDVHLWHSQDQTFARVAQAIQSYLAEAGIRVTLVQRDAPSAREASRKGETDLIIKDWWADYPDAENFLYPLLFSGNAGVGGNVSFYASPAFDRLITLARKESRDSTRVRLYRQADSIAMADAPMIFLFVSEELYAVQPWIDGFQPPVIFNGQRWTGVRITR